MAKIVFTNKAKEDLQDIWEYTCEAWSEKQADLYYEEIIERCLELAINFKQGKDYAKLFQSLKGVKRNKHIIFYRILQSNLVEIVRILHEKMDMQKHLSE